MRVETLENALRRAVKEKHRVVQIELIEWVELQHEVGSDIVMLGLREHSIKVVRAVPMPANIYSTNVRETLVAPFRVWTRDV